MGNELLASKVVIQREAPALLTIEGVPTSSVGLTGVAEWGPIGEPTLITSWPEFKGIFGNFLLSHHMPVSVYMALKAPKGSKRLWIARVTHFTDPDDKATTIALYAQVFVNYSTLAQGAVTSGNPGPWNLENNETLVVHADADPAGPDTATFLATPARLVGGAFGVVPAGGTLAMTCDRDPDTQGFTFVGGETVAQAAALINATASGFHAIVVGGVTLDFQSDTEGLASAVAVTADTLATAAALGHTAPSSDTGGGNVQDIDAVTFLEAKALIEAAVIHPATGVTCTEEVGGELTITSNGVAGPASKVQVTAASTALDFNFDNLVHSGGGASGKAFTAFGKYRGAMVNSWVVRIADATSGAPDRFNLIVLDDAGAIKEVWPNLIHGGIYASDPFYINTIINGDAGSKYIRTTDVTAVTARPTNGDYVLISGDDGLTGLADADFLGEAGLTCFKYASEFVAIKAIPGKTSAGINQSIVADAEATGHFGILDPPSGCSATAIVAYVAGTAALYELSEMAAINWPWAEVPNPDASVYGVADSIMVPPSGPALAAYLNNDSRVGGVHEAPAGLENGRLWGVIGVEHRDALNPDKLDIVYPVRINPITRLSRGGAFFIDGSRTLLSTGPFPSIGESRGMIYIEQSIKRSAEWVRHKNLVDRLYRSVYTGIVLFLRGEMAKDAFASRDEATAFYVDVSDSINPPSEKFARKLNIRVAVAKAKPAEWVIITVTQDIRLLQEEIGLT